MATNTYPIYGYRVTILNRQEVIVWSGLISGSQEKISKEIEKKYPPKYYSAIWRDYTEEEFKTLQLLGF